MQSLIFFAGVLALAAAGNIGGYGEIRTIVGGEKSIIAGPSGTIHADTGAIIRSEGVLAPRVLPAAPLLSAPLLPAAPLVNTYASARIIPASTGYSVNTVHRPAIAVSTPTRVFQSAPLIAPRIVESAPLIAPRIFPSAPLVAPRIIESAPLVSTGAYLPRLASPLIGSSSLYENRLISSAPLLNRYAAAPVLSHAGVPLYNNGQYGLNEGLEAPYY